ncbi:DUF3048 domain-containing protein [Caldalkalibacillus thermarum TA2.A1]|uniref:DUF3048 domain-containing protein n=1 Tax=Caldalkalibacillus thermarum (strain TA2.A1) TaxID=986075 RepID=A0A8X8I5J5_CALTT|nr:DUF3048 domain-containing protein [Caldalkalibacillus thermarum]QZT34635.1 DUF3048 domain-containing protein [Caldalkalibacillus thermarum TA2.A1]
MKHVQLFLLALTACIVFSACSQKAGDTQDSAQQPETNQTEEQAQQEPPEQGPLAPLTGRQVDEPLEQRIVGVMIDNHPAARPQSGLVHADIVYEILAEGPITRYLALFHSHIPDVIGPVRSLRPYYLDIARGYDAVVAHAGGSPAAKEEVIRTGYPSFDDTRNGGFVFYRSDHRQAPHNLYTGRALLEEGEARFGYDENYEIPALRFKPEAEAMNGQAAEWLEIVYDSRYYQVAYEYETGSGTYTRYINGEQHTDAESGQPLTASNVLIIEASHRVLDDAGRRDIKVQGEGRGYLCQRGKWQEITWKYQDGVIRPFVDGVEVGLYPGNTWVNIIPDNPGLEESVSLMRHKP